MPHRRTFHRKVSQGARRRLRRRPGLVRFGLGMLGTVGWSVVVPALLGMALGDWLDGLAPERVSWRLSLMLAGLTLGCFNAWRWVDQEWQELKREEERHAPEP